ncbi:hypothetical protein [Aureimonas populi]|uniref:Uncharacterized protein n=1 Tax=Aureimonas populi TaxID=1701758 RepID=A0ABW5CJF8_9HYPH|nr:hypothetical protein [Aureimonas populi]
MAVIESMHDWKRPVFARKLRERERPPLVRGAEVLILPCIRRERMEEARMGVEDVAGAAG